jgi:hypothetical protein
MIQSCQGIEKKGIVRAVVQKWIADWLECQPGCNLWNYAFLNKLMKVQLLRKLIAEKCQFELGIIHTNRRA